MRFLQFSGISSLLVGLTGSITARLVIIVSVSIMITASLGYLKLYQVTEVNSAVRIDRAARAATALFTGKLASEYTAIRDLNGTPLAIRLNSDSADLSLSFRTEYDTLLKEIGLINQGAANLFKLNPNNNAFDRFATTFRKPDGSMPPPMSIDVDHIAFNDIINNRPHLGEVPVMGRMRLAYLIPIQTVNGVVAGALAVDVGWVDDLVSARDDLRVQFIIAAVIILAFAMGFGVTHMGRELKPLRELAKFADDLAAEDSSSPVPYSNRKDEIGALALGLERVVTLQDKLAHLAYRDELTGLGNRTRYISDLKAFFRLIMPVRHPLILIHLDLDNFKYVNNAHGQKTGDALLKTVASRISCIVGEGSKVSRLASDQFTILIEGQSSTTYASVISRNILEIFDNPFNLTEGDVHLTVSIGVNLVHTDSGDMDDAHRNASLALRRAKANGGNQIIFYSSDIDDEFQDQVRLERMLRNAIKGREIEVHFQPQITPSKNEFAGVEALARWTHSEEGSIPPNKFIPIAEASGQIIDLGTLILDLACEQAAKWQQEMFAFKHISVNVSPIQLWQSNFIDILKDALERHNLPGKSIYIEVTESVFVHHDERRIITVLAAIRSLGVKLSLDDFGAGYSSLGYLNRLPFDQLKIDRSFVVGIDVDKHKQQVLRGVLELARGLGFDIVVEGAETLEEVEVIKEMGCDSIQGFFYAKPAPASLMPGIAKRILKSDGCLKRRTA